MRRAAARLALLLAQQQLGRGEDEVDPAGQQAVEVVDAAAVATRAFPLPARDHRD